MTTMTNRIRDDIIRTGATSMSGKTRPVIDTWQSSAKGEPATCQLSSLSTKLQNLDSKLQITNRKINIIKPGPCLTKEQRSARQKVNLLLVRFLVYL